MLQDAILVIFSIYLHSLGDLMQKHEFGYLLYAAWASLVAQLVKNLPEMWEAWV